MFEKSNSLLALATGSRGYTDKTHRLTVCLMSRTVDDCDSAIALFDKMVDIVGEVHKSFTL
ncbi:MAG: hypothetical protein V7L14_01480 [Nostoc sp.]|uniref:hypothetical protein n=1 Tax=Nostoc sp. TaxID=1180 RepID=UPI002FF7C7BE